MTSKELLTGIKGEVLKERGRIKFKVLNCSVLSKIESKERKTNKVAFEPSAEEIRCVFDDI